MQQSREKHLEISPARTQLEVLMNLVLDARRTPPSTTPLTLPGLRIAPDKEQPKHKVWHEQVDVLRACGLATAHAPALCHAWRCCGVCKQPLHHSRHAALQVRIWTNLLPHKQQLVTWKFRTQSKEGSSKCLHSPGSLLFQKAALVHLLCLCTACS